MALLDPGTNLDELFGIDIEPRKTKGGRVEDKGIKVKIKDGAGKAERKAEKAGKGWLRHVGNAWNTMTPKTRTAATYGAGGILVGGAIAILSSHLRSTPAAAEAVPTPKAAPPPPPPTKVTARAGATLTVTTPKRQAGTLRSVASPAGAVVAYLPHGTVVTVESSATGSDGHRWYQIKTVDGKLGWMHGGILT